MKGGRSQPARPVFGVVATSAAAPEKAASHNDTFRNESTHIDLDRVVERQNPFGRVDAIDAAPESPVSTTFEVWYDLPSLRREAVISVSFQFQDADDATFTKRVDFNVAP